LFTIQPPDTYEVHLDEENIITVAEVFLAGLMKY